MNTRTWKQVEKLRKRASAESRTGSTRAWDDFRDDLAAASEWVAAYLESVGERPVVAGCRRRRDPRRAARVAAGAGGAVRRRARRPRRADRARAHALEPPALLRLLREHRLRAGDPRRAADRRAERERDGLVTSPAATELEQLVLDWLAQLLGLPPACTATSRTPPRPRRSPPSPRRATTGPAESCTRSEHAHFSVEKAARILGLEFRTVPVDDEFRMLDRLPARRRGRRRRDGRDDLVDVGRPGGGDRRPLRGGGRLAARRRRVRGLGVGLPRASLVPRGRRARRLDRRQPAQVAVHADGLLDALDAAPGRRSAPRSRPTATTSPRPRARSTSATTGRRSAGGSARSSSGPCCAATAATACRR